MSGYLKVLSPTKETWEIGCWIAGCIFEQYVCFIALGQA